MDAESNNLLPAEQLAPRKPSYLFSMLTSHTHVHVHTFQRLPDGSWNVRICPVWTEVLVFFIGFVG